MSLARSLYLLALAACAAAHSPREDGFRERRLAILPESARQNLPIAFSDDGSRAAYIDQEGNACRVVAGEWKSRAFERLC